MSSALQKLQEYKYEKARLKRTGSNQESSPSPSTSSSSSSSPSFSSAQSASSTPRSQSTASLPPPPPSQRRTAEPITLELGTSDIEPDEFADEDDNELSDSTVDSDLRSGVKNMLTSNNQSKHSPANRDISSSFLSAGAPRLGHVRSIRSSSSTSPRPQQPSPSYSSSSSSSTSKAVSSDRTISPNAKSSFSSLVGSFQYSGSDASPKVFPVSNGTSSSPSRASTPNRPNKRAILISDEDEDVHVSKTGSSNSSSNSNGIQKSGSTSPNAASPTAATSSDIPKRRRLVKKRYIIDSDSDDYLDKKTAARASQSMDLDLLDPATDPNSPDMDETPDSTDAMLARLAGAFPNATMDAINNAMRRSKGEYSAAVTLLAQQLDDLFTTTPSRKASSPQSKPLTSSSSSSLSLSSTSSSSSPTKDPKRLQRISPYGSMVHSKLSLDSTTPATPTTTTTTAATTTTTTTINTTTKISQAQQPPPKVHIIPSGSEAEEDFDEKSMDSDDDDDDDDDATGSDGPEDYRNQEKKEQRALQFFNTAPATELSELTGCRKEQAEKIVSLRPFDNFDSLCVTLRKTKGVGERVVYNYLTTTDAIRAVDMMLHTVAKVRRSLVHTLNIWCGGGAENRLLEATGSVKQMLSENRREMDKEAAAAASSLSSKRATLNNNNSNAEDDDNASTTSTADEPGLEITELDMAKLQESEAGKRALREYIQKQPGNMAPTFRLKDYQLLGLNWLALLWRKKLSGILADEMGLGKTAQVIAFLAHLVEQGEEGPFLIIVPSSTLANWMREFEKFCPDLVVRSYYGSQAERQELREELVEDTSYNVVVTTYNIATGNSDERKFLNKRRFRAIILDEGHMVKNCTSARYKSLMSIKAPFRLLLTGTPLQNNLEELLSLLIFIMPALFQEHEEVLRTMFKVKIDTANEKSNLLSKERITRARQMIAPFVLRRKKIHVLKDLPAKIHTIVECDLVPAQRALYNRLMETSALQAALRESEAAEVAAAAALLEGGVVKGGGATANSKGKKQTTTTPKTTAAAAKAVAATRKAANEQFANLLMQLRKAADHPMLFRERYEDGQLRTMAKTITREIEFCDSNIDYIEEDMSVMTDFELDRLCKQYK
ncbi:hypothetical protein DFQ27_006955, partial [Actinomortierella ambigua]